MDIKNLIEKYHPPAGASYSTYMAHAEAVSAKALGIANRLGNLDLKFIQEAALLHDIGICRIHAPEIGCYGALPYICHGIEGRDILLLEGLPQHARVCERHIGVGLTAEDVLRQKLPLPSVDMIPETPEEQIIAYADLFFSKAPGRLDKEKPLKRVRESVGRWGEEKLRIFERWHRGFA